MEKNPITRLYSMNRNLKITIGVIVTILVVSVIGITQYFDYKQQSILEENRKLKIKSQSVHKIVEAKDRVIKEKEEKLKQQQKELNEYWHTKNRIVSYISKYKKGKEMGPVKREHLAKLIIKNAKEIGIKPRLYAALCASESGFDMTANNHMPFAKGITGVNPQAWTSTLIKKGIITCRSDLHTNPEKNLKAGAYIFKHYLKQEKGDVLAALTYYKGYSPLGRKQAMEVIKKSYSV